MPGLAIQPRNSSRISDCVITSSALVASSAISSAGRCMTAMAISTRCAWPTLSCDGYLRRNSSSSTAGSRFPARPGSRCRSRALGPEACARQASLSWVRIFERRIQRRKRTLQHEAILRPRSLASSRSRSVSRSRPRKSMLPSTWRACGRAIREWPSPACSCPTRSVRPVRHLAPRDLE